MKAVTQTVDTQFSGGGSGTLITKCSQGSFIASWADADGTMISITLESRTLEDAMTEVATIRNK